MPITNLNNTHLTTAQATTATTALTALETALAVININLSAEDRQLMAASMSKTNYW